MTTGDPQPPKDLDARLRALRERTIGAGESRGSPQGPPPSAMGMAFRIGVELVAGLVVGGGIGWLLDRWLGTLPIMLIAFFFLGAAAGMMNVFRAVRRMNEDEAGGGPKDQSGGGGTKG